MSRTSVRRHTFKLIFMFEFLHSDIDNMFNLYASNFLQEFDEYEKGITYDELNGVCENLEEIDEMINENSKWAFNRLNKIFKNENGEEIVHTWDNPYPPIF